MSTTGFLFLLKLLFLVPFISFSQNSFKNFDVTKKYPSKSDTILYMSEMSNYLDTTYLNRFEDEVLKYQIEDIENGITKGQVLFIGSSSFQKWSALKKDMFPIPVINRGFGGSTMPEAIYYFNRLVMPYKPAVIVLYEGDNDVLAPFLTPDVIFENFKLFVRMTEKYSAESVIYFLSIKPSPSRIEYLDKMLITNMLIKEFCNTKKILNYIDITEPMYNYDGEIREDIFLSDKLHMNEKGYEIWTKIIKNTLLN